MNHLLSCEFNIDTACVELKYADGAWFLIDTIAVENEEVDNIYEHSELDYLIYNAPAEYVDLILNGNPVKYLKIIRLMINCTTARTKILRAVLSLQNSQEVANFS